MSCETSAQGDARPPGPSHDSEACAAAPADGGRHLAPFRNWHALMLAAALFTYIVDVALDVILAVAYISDGYAAYFVITVALTLGPTIIVQVFSIRWHQVDETMDKPQWIIHSFLMGVLYRYLVVIQYGIEAMNSNDAIDYQMFYQQQSDVTMLRLFDSFLESAPQLVFHLFVMIDKEDEWTWGQATWTTLSAIASMVSLGWGVTAYGAAMRMTVTAKGNMSWMGMVLQTVWRFGMLTARIVALVMLALALREWVIIVLFCHWFLMTIWVLLQKTDFCEYVWEERLFNAVVGAIYIFDFVNLKEGQSRYRMALFYCIIVIENFACLGAYFYLVDTTHDYLASGLSIGAFAIMITCTLMGLVGMMLYYRFFHPAGPINPCLDYKQSDNKSEDEKGKRSTSRSTLNSIANESRGPDFVIEDTSIPHSGQDTPPRPPPRRGRVQYSRSFKDARPTKPRVYRRTDSKGRTTSASPSPPELPPKKSSFLDAENDLQGNGKPDSAYSTDSNRTGSRNTVSTPRTQSPDTKIESPLSSPMNSSGSIAYNNDTYMSVEEEAKREKQESYSESVVFKPAALDSSQSLSQCSQPSIDSRVTVIERSEYKLRKLPCPSPPASPNESDGECQPEKLLKRSPVVKDVTLGFAHVSSTNSVINEKSGRSCNKSLESDLYGQKKQVGQQNPPARSANSLKAPLTIIIPNISHQAIARSNSGPSVGEKTINLQSLNPIGTGLEGLAAHDYENLALININRAPVGVSHWRTYSDMANSKHDESTAYERRQQMPAEQSGAKSKEDHADYSNYGSLQYFDIYPLNRELKSQLYRNLTPLSTAATVASDTVNNTTDSSDTYEPIEAFTPGAWNEEDEGNVPDFRSDHTSATYANNAVPVTLIHHDGQKLTTEKIVTVDNLKEALRRHENVPMDDPQDRGDLYLLAPMRLLTPILEEPEYDVTSSVYSRTTHSHKGANKTYGDMNKSIMTVISEILGDNNLYSHPGPVKPVPRIINDWKPATADGRQADSIESTSSLVHTIDEIRNNSLCNLFFSSSFNDLSSSPAKPAPQVPPRNPSPGNSSSAIPKTKIDSGESKLKAPCGAKGRELPPPPPPPYIHKRENAIIQQENISQQLQCTTKNVSPLVFGVGSRRNILEMTKKTGDILNTPNKKLASADPAPPGRPPKVPLPLASAPAHISMENTSPNTQGVLREMNVSSNAKACVSRCTNTSSLHSSTRPSVVLSPSSKYETPTPPLRANQFVRNSQSYRPRRRFSILRNKFEEESPIKAPMNASSTSDLYQNISDNLLNTDLSHISKSCSFIDSKDFELRPDEQYENLERGGWATSSMRPIKDDEKRRSMPPIFTRADKENRPIVPNKHRASLGVSHAFKPRRVNETLSPSAKIFGPQRTSTAAKSLFKEPA